MTVYYYNPNDVQDNPYQPRRHYSRKDIDERAKSIKEIGLQQIPSGRLVDGKPQLLFGHIRKRAFIKLHKEDKIWQFPVDIQELTDEQMAIGGLAENLERSDITPLDVALAVDKILTDFPDQTETALAKKINMTQGNVANMRRVVKLPEKILEKVEDGSINFTMARELCVFQGVSAGTYSKYDHKLEKSVEHEKGPEYLMLKALEGLATHLRYYNGKATVNAMKKMIYDVCVEQLRHLEPGQGWRGNQDPLFDTRAAGCLKCKSMIRANRTSSEVKHFCYNFDCWDAKQKEHREARAAEAIKQMQVDVAAIVKGQEEKLVDVPKEIIDQAVEVVATEPAKDDDDICRHIPQEEVEYARERISKLFGTGRPCLGCINIGHCPGNICHLVSGGVKAGDEVWECEGLLRPGDAEKLREKAAAVPDEVKDILKGAVGTRAELLDINELRVGGYNQDLQTGYTCLNEDTWIGGNSWNGGKYGKWIDHLLDPQECTERCTAGFHYAYDSKQRFDRDEKNPAVLFVCSNQKCLAKKKSAYTRSINEEGQARRRAENIAIKKAAQETTTLDRVRMIVIIKTMIESDSYSYRSKTELSDFLWDRLFPETTKEGRKNQALYASLHNVTLRSEQEIAAALVEGCLRLSQDQTDNMTSYKIKTREQLGWLGIDVVVKKKEKKEPDPEPEATKAKAKKKPGKASKKEKAVVK